MDYNKLFNIVVVSLIYQGKGQANGLKEGQAEPLYANPNQSVGKTVVHPCGTVFRITDIRDPLTISNTSPKARIQTLYLAEITEDSNESDH